MAAFDGDGYLDHVVGVAVVAGHQPAAAHLLHRLQEVAQVAVHRGARAYHCLQVASVTHLRATIRLISASVVVPSPSAFLAL